VGAQQTRAHATDVAQFAAERAAQIQAGQTAASAAVAAGKQPPVGEGWLGERDQSDSLKARLIAEWTEAFGAEIDPVADFQEHH